MSIKIDKKRGPKSSVMQHESQRPEDSIVEISSFGSRQESPPSFFQRFKHRRVAMALTPLKSQSKPKKEIKPKNKFLQLLTQSDLIQKFKNKMLKLSSSKRYKQLSHDDKAILEWFSQEKFGDEMEDTSRLIIRPGSKFSVAWNSFQNIIFLLLLFVLPLNYAFRLNFEELFHYAITNWVFITFIECDMIIDMVLHSVTGFMHQGEIVTNRSIVLRNYIKQDLLYDFVSLISLQVPLIWSSTASVGLFILFTSLFFCLKISIIAKSFTQFREQIIPTQNSLLNLSESQNQHLDLLILIFKVTMVAHIFACVWHGVAYYQELDESWLVKQGVRDDDMWVRYNYSFYWASATMITVGYGDITPTNDIERLVANITMYIGCGVFAFSLNGIGIILQEMNKSNEYYRKIISSMNSYMKKHNIKYALQNKVRSYIEYQLKDKTESDEDIQFGCNILSTTLKHELQEQARAPITSQLKWLGKFSAGFKSRIAHKFEEIKYSPGDIIIRQNQIDDCSIYLIQEGNVTVNFKNQVIKRLNQQQTFGEYAFFTNLPRTCSVVSNGYSKFLKLTRNNFLKTITKSSDQLLYEQIKFDVKNNKYNKCNISCYSCQGDHLIKFCPNFHLILDKEVILKRNDFPYVQSRFQVPRNKKTKSNAFFNLNQIQFKADRFQNAFSYATSAVEKSIVRDTQLFIELQSSQENWLQLGKQVDDIDLNPNFAPQQSKNSQVEFHSAPKIVSKEEALAIPQTNNFSCLPLLDKITYSKTNRRHNLKYIINQLNKEKITVKPIHSPYTFNLNAIKMIELIKQYLS